MLPAGAFFKRTNPDYPFRSLNFWNPVTQAYLKFNRASFGLWDKEWTGEALDVHFYGKQTDTLVALRQRESNTTPETTRYGF
jgi:hypothetical protein